MKKILFTILFTVFLNLEVQARTYEWKLVTTSYGAKIFHSTKIEKKRNNILETWVIADYFKTFDKIYNSTLYKVQFNCENLTTNFLKKIKFSTNMAQPKTANGKLAKTLDLLDTKETGKWYPDIKYGWWTMSADATCNYKEKKKEKKKSKQVQQKRIKKLEKSLSKKEIENLKELFDDKELEEFSSKDDDKWKFLEEEIKEAAKQANKLIKSLEECLQENNKYLEQCKNLKDNKENKQKLKKEIKKKEEVKKEEVKKEEVKKEEVKDCKEEDKIDKKC